MTLMAMKPVDLADLDAEQIVAQHGPFVLMVAGMIPVGTATYEQWHAATVWVQQVEKASPFWIGDLLAYGEAAWGEKYTQAVEATGHKIGYLMNIASVAQKIPAAERHAGLSFSHHQAVAALPLVERTEWLDKAEVEDWTVKNLQDQIKVAKAQETGQTLVLGVWVGCADLADQTAFYDAMVKAGRPAKTTSREI
jgi:hypothetical protein